MARACEVVEQRVDSSRILARSDSPAQEQGQRDERELKDVCLLVEAREAVPVAGDGEPEVLQSPDGELQSIERGAEDMLDDDESAVRREDQAVGREGRVRDVVDCCCRAAIAETDSRMNHAANAG